MLKRELDYLAIPDSSGKLKKDRIKKAVQEIHKRMVEKIIIMKGRDSEEDILYLGKVVKKGDVVGIDTFPLHYDEYKDIIKKAEKEGKFPRGVKIENIQVGQSPKRALYGFLGLMEEKFKSDVKYKKNTNRLWERVKGIVKKILLG
ncbi:hypothetical protein HY212_03535 [Candidatus Pacearchaeota archaeon]|nr:hypothetical protein [Candidatus Pacearchaeota archaeon]